MRSKKWLLPDGVDEVLPPYAGALESLRRRLLNVFERWGYDLVEPPLLEYLESLLSGIGEDLDLQTFKLIDQASGKLLGIRADITPQIARIDAHRMPADIPQRFCYCGSVLHTRPDKFSGSRNPLQLGAELYGHDGIESDAEVTALLIEILRAAEVVDVTLEFGHMGLFHAICEQAHLDAAAESRVLECLLMKDEGGLTSELSATDIAHQLSDCLMGLLELNGDTSVLARARERLRAAPPRVNAALDEVARLIELLERYVPGVDIHLDFAELRGYRYHTGITFAAYTPEAGRAIAWGGRYDNIGQSFGRARSATGFSTDLKVLLNLNAVGAAQPGRVYAPPGSEPGLLAAIREYRNTGYSVVQGLPGQQGDPRAMGCAHTLAQRDGQWQLDDA